LGEERAGPVSQVAKIIVEENTKKTRNAWLPLLGVIAHLQRATAVPKAIMSYPERQKKKTVID
jgi:hypothetical protein